MARRGDDPEMRATPAETDVALLDTSAEHRREIEPDGLNVIVHGQEAVPRYNRPGARRYSLVTDTNINEPFRRVRVEISSDELFEA